MIDTSAVQAEQVVHTIGRIKLDQVGVVVGCLIRAIAATIATAAS